VLIMVRQVLYSLWMLMIILLGLSLSWISMVLIIILEEVSNRLPVRISRLRI